MKKELFIARPAKFYSAAILTSMLLFCGIMDITAQTAAEDQNKSQVSYIGSANDLLTFNVNFNNIQDEKFVLEITDDLGEVLYRNAYSGRTFNKNIFLKNMGDNCTVHFNLKSGKQFIHQQFEISAQTRLIRETVVTKI